MAIMEAIQQCDTIVEMIDEEVSEKAKAKAGEFFEDVKAQVTDMQETLVNASHVTVNQQRALDNWEAAVAKWIH